MLAIKHNKPWLIIYALITLTNAASWWVRIGKNEVWFKQTYYKGQINFQERKLYSICLTPWHGLEDTGSGIGRNIITAPHRN